MPSKSPAQHRLMQAVAHSPEFAKKVGIPPSVGMEFTKEDRARKSAAAVAALRSRRRTSPP